MFSHEKLEKLRNIIRASPVSHDPIVGLSAKLRRTIFFVTAFKVTQIFNHIYIANDKLQRNYEGI